MLKRFVYTILMERIAQKRIDCFIRHFKFLVKRGLAIWQGNVVLATQCFHLTYK